jgi:hypothetical protein
MPSASSSQAKTYTPLSLNFERGIKFSKAIQQKFGQSVNFVPGFRKREIFLVDAFGRTNFKLNVHTVGVALQACIGGHAAKFQVKLLRERVFRFSVESRSIGIEIYNAGKILEDHFSVHFYLWGKGGPNWMFEEKKYYQEEDTSWTTISNHKFSNPKVSVFKRLSFSKPSPKRSVFSRVKFPAVYSQSIGTNSPRSYAQVVNSNQATNGLNDVRNHEGKNLAPASNILRFKEKSLRLPGILPFMNTQHSMCQMFCPGPMILAKSGSRPVTKSIPPPLQLPSVHFFPC